MSFEDIQTAADRKQVQESADQAQNDSAFLAAKEAARQTAMQSHFMNIIIRWTGETDVDSPCAFQMALDLPINQLITTSILNDWETALTAKGYVITRNGTSFKVELTP